MLKASVDQCSESSQQKLRYLTPDRERWAAKELLANTTPSSPANDRTSEHTVPTGLLASTHGDQLSVFLAVVKMDPGDICSQERGC